MTEDDRIDDERHEQLRVDLAGYVLGGLTLEEQQAVEAHLRTCAPCRDLLGELDPIPALLALAGDQAPPAVDDPTRAPTDAPVRALPRVDPSATASTRGAAHRPPTGAGIPTADEPASADAAGTGRPGGRWWSARPAKVVLAALAVAAALLIGIVIGRPASPRFDNRVTLAAAPAAGDVTARGTASFRTVEQGTLVHLDLTGLPASEGVWYECVWAGAGGNRSAGTFRPATDGSVEVDLVTSARLYPGWTLSVIEHGSSDQAGHEILTGSA